MENVEILLDYHIQNLKRVRLMYVWGKLSETIKI